MPNEKPTHVYVGRKECGCVIALATDMRDKHTGDNVAEFISDGLTVDRVDWETYKEKISLEETFMKCPHGQLALPI
jgi:hypothetical protein